MGFFGPDTQLDHISQSLCGCVSLLCEMCVEVNCATCLLKEMSEGFKGKPLKDGERF